MGKCPANRNVFAAYGFSWWIWFVNVTRGKRRTFLLDEHIAIVWGIGTTFPETR